MTQRYVTPMLNQIPHFIYFFMATHPGITKTSANRENSRPLMVPTAKANQNTSLVPSIRNGISPSTVETTVREIGTILWLKARMYN